MDTEPNTCTIPDLEVEFAETMNCQGVTDLTQYTPPNSGQEEELAALQSRVKEYAPGMRQLWNTVFDENR
jgi:hypothetical protein